MVIMTMNYISDQIFQINTTFTSYQFYSYVADDFFGCVVFCDICLINSAAQAKNPETRQFAIIIKIRIQQK